MIDTSTSGHWETGHALQAPNSFKLHDVGGILLIKINPQLDQEGRGLGQRRRSTFDETTHGHNDYMDNSRLFNLSSRKFLIAHSLIVRAAP